MGKIIIKDESSVATPVGTGKHSIYVDRASGKIKKKDTAGNEEVVVNESLFDTMISLVGDSVFGDGSDGDIIISTDTTLARDMYYNNLTINSTKVLNPNGYRIYVKGTLLNNGIIRSNGGNGGNGFVSTSNSAIGGAAGASAGTGSLNAAVPGHVGQGSWNTYGGSNGTAAINVLSFYETYSQNNGANGNSITGGISKRGILYNSVFDFKKMILTMLGMASPKTISYKISGMAAPGTGYIGSDSSVYSYGSGGGSGASGGLIWICAKIFNNAGVIEAKGGTGGNGILGAAGRDGGAGGGGHGGFLFLIYNTLTAQGTVTLTGGAGGTGGAGAGAAGANGEIILNQINL